MNKKIIEQSLEEVNSEQSEAAVEEVANELQIHSFEETKNEIKEFSNNIEPNVELDKVATSGGLFKLFKHTVNGTELNNLTGQIQGHIITLNSQLIKVTEEFIQVYNALEALDKEYIQGILISIKQTEETSEQLKKSQHDINQMIGIQRKSIERLLELNEKINRINHLADTDEMYDDIEGLNDRVDIINQRINELAKTVTNIEEYIEYDKYTGNSNVGDVQNNGAMQEKSQEYISSKTMLIRRNMNCKIAVAYIISAVSLVGTIVMLIFHFCGVN